MRRSKGSALCDFESDLIEAKKEKVVKLSVKLSVIQGPWRATQQFNSLKRLCPICLRLRLPIGNRSGVQGRSTFVPPLGASLPRRSFATKRPAKPLSFAELVERQRQQELKAKERDQAKKEFELAIRQTSKKLKKSTKSAFRPAPGSKRHIRALLKLYYRGINNSYPFPEDVEPLKGIRRRKRIYFKKGHQFRLERYLAAQYKRALASEKEPKKLERQAKRAAFRIFLHQHREKKQMEFNKDIVMNWKEGEETYILPVTTADIAEVTKDKVAFKRFSETSTSIKLAAQLLQDDCVVAFPTETVYGLGANALSSSAVQKIYQAKNRPSDNPLIAHFGSTRQLEEFTEIPKIYIPLIESFWPGPLTILIPVKPKMGISPLVTAGLNTVAVRVPSNPLARALISEANVPIAAPSANASTRPSPTLAAHVEADLNGRIPLILSADEDPASQCDVGLESTVVDGLSSPPTILRLGGVSLEQIRALGGIWRTTVIYQKPTSNGTTEEEFKPRTPGMKYRHYSPNCPVYVFKAGSPQPELPSKYLPLSDVEERKVAVLCTNNWEPKSDPNAQVEFNWLGGDAEEVARNLFKCVRDMDQWGAEVIIVEGVEEKGIGRSVMERLKKMAGGVIEGSERDT